MSTAVQFRGGTTAQHASFTGAPREITVDTTTHTVVVHDGVTPGGHPLLPASQNVFLKADYSTVAFSKTGAQTLTLKVGTVYATGGQLYRSVAPVPVTMPTLAAGTDYAIFANPNGSLQAVADPFSSRATPPQPGSRQIGGFHFGLVAPSTTVAGGAFATSGTGMRWAQADVNRIAGINEFSVWDLCFRATGEQHGMALDPYTNLFGAIYFCGTEHIANGISKYNTDIASGTVLPKIPLAYGGNGTSKYTALNWWAASEIAHSHGCRLMFEREFSSAAYGVTENQSLGGAASTVPATIRQAGYTSRIGLEQATGHQYTWGQDSSFISGTGAVGWVDQNGGRGQIYLMNPVGLARVRLGGHRNEAEHSGSQSSNWYNYPWSSSWRNSLRAASDLKISNGIG